MPSARSVEEIISGLPRWEKVLVQRLRALVLECLPRASEEVRYGAIYYSHHRMICFLWPPSIWWGGHRPTEEEMRARGVSLGFCKGYLMANEDGMLLAEGRKQIYIRYIRTPADIVEGSIRAWLYEAEMIDDSFVKKKLKRQ